MARLAGVADAADPISTIDIARLLIAAGAIADAADLMVTALTSYPDDAGVAEIAGDTAFAGGDSDRACSHWSRAFELEQRWTALERLAAVEADVEGIDRPWLARLRAERSMAPRTLALQSAAAARDGRSDDSRRLAIQALQGNRDLPVARVVLLSLAIEERRERDAEVEVAHLVAGSTPPLRSLAELSWQASVAGYPRLAAQLAERALLAAPWNVDLAKLAARAWLASGSATAARRVLLSRAALVEDDPEARYLLVVATAADRDTSAARAVIARLRGIAAWERVELFVAIGDARGAWNTLRATPAAAAARQAASGVGVGATSDAGDREASDRLVAARARVYLLEGDTESALQTLATLAAPVPRDQTLRAEILLVRGSGADALRRIAADLTSSDEPGSAAYVRGLGALAAGHDERARKEFETALRQRPDSAAAALQLAACLRAEEPSAALEIIRTAVARNPAQPELRGDLGSALRTAIDRDGLSAVSAQEAAAFAESAPDVGRARAARLLDEGAPADAERACRRLVIQNPDDGLARTFLGLALLRSGRPKSAPEELERAGASAPQPLHGSVRAAVLLALGRSGAAAEVAHEILATGSAETSRGLRSVLARALLSLGRHDEAREIAVALTGVESASSASWILLATVEDARGDAVAAEAALRRAVARPDGPSEALGRLAVRLVRSGGIDEARKMLPPVEECPPVVGLCARVDRVARRARVRGHSALAPRRRSGSSGRRASRILARTRWPL